jgi:hypothetical protein
MPQNTPDPEWVGQYHIVRPFQGRDVLPICSVGFTHGYSGCSPSANLGATLDGLATSAKPFMSRLYYPIHIREADEHE